MTPKFGDLIENGYASEDNPTRRGYFVRAFRRTGKLNAGLTWEVTDRKGKFWTLPVHGNDRLIVTPAPDQDKEGPAIPEGWRPIETAPLDGTPVLLVVDASAQGPGATSPKYGVGGYCLGRRVLFDWDWGFAPTHWMPLPARPTQDVGAGSSASDGEALATEPKDRLSALPAETKGGG